MDILHEYPWAVNPYKLQRALDELAAQDKKATQASVRELYEKYGGLVREVEEKKKK